MTHVIEPDNDSLLDFVELKKIVDFTKPVIEEYRIKMAQRKKADEKKEKPYRVRNKTRMRAMESDAEIDRDLVSLQDRLGNRATQQFLANKVSDPQIQRQPDRPQSFAGAELGTQPIDPVLMARNEVIEESLFAAAEAYYENGDFRWFFSHSHAEITQRINANIAAFQNPNALLRLNIHFAEEFIRAVGGQPHEVWQRAFRICRALQQNSSENPFLVGEIEACGAAMANTHIHIDLANALREVGCIPPSDYGNMLVFVNQGMLAAIVKLRGQALGAAEVMVQYLVAPMLDLEVKAWRNAAYTDVCNTPVPGVEPNFGRRTGSQE